MGLADENQGVARAASLLEAPGEGLFSGPFRSPEVPASLGWRPRPPSPELAVIPLSLCFHLTAALTPFSLTKAWWSHWPPGKVHENLFIPVSRFFTYYIVKVFRRVRQETPGCQGKDADVFGGGGDRHSAASSFRLYEHLLVHAFTLLPSLHLYAIYPPV